jgi:hypothetical protein
MSDANDQWADEAQDAAAERASSEPFAALTVREFFEAFAWDGVAPDPSQTSAREFLAWL